MKHNSLQKRDQRLRMYSELYHGIDPFLWLVHFGVHDIMPGDPDATCEHCVDRLAGVCSEKNLDPIECMKQKSRTGVIEVF